MKIIAFSDVHERYDRVRDVLRHVPSADAVVVAGDLTTNGTSAEVERIVAEWQPFAPALFAVAGNMDSPAIDDALNRLGVSLNAVARQIGRVAFFGCSAAPVSIGTPYEIPESEIAERIERGFGQVAEGSQLVFVPHAPPHGVLDRTSTGVPAGSRAVRSFIDRVEPAVVICGHIHEARGQVRLGKSLVVNCGPANQGRYAMITLDGDECRAELL